jgi:iron-sulfur cluster assembly accessory protein
MAINISDKAKGQLIELLNKNNKTCVMLSAKGGGCAGFKYDWSFIDESKVDDNDSFIDLGNGKFFIIDSHSVPLIDGMTVDWKEEIFGSSFELTNPNAKSSCGCGESFGV